MQPILNLNHLNSSFRWSLSLFLAILLGMQPVWLSADNTTTTATTGVTGTSDNFADYVPGIQGGFPGFSNGYCSCVNNASSMQNIFTPIADAFTGKKSSSGGGTCGSTNVTAPSNACSKTAEQTFNDKINAANTAITCKNNAIAAAKNQMTCMSNQAAVVAQQVAQLQQVYTSNISRMEQDVQKINALKSDRQSQLDFVNEKLNGAGKDGGNGGKGLLKLRDETLAMINQMPGQIAQIKSKQDEATRQRAIVEEEVQNRTMALTNSCFTTNPLSGCTCASTDSTFMSSVSRCSQGATADSLANKPQSAYCCVICRYTENQYIQSDGTTGQGQQSSTANNKANAALQQLEGVLDAVLTNSPSDPNNYHPPSQQNNADAAFSFENQSRGVLSVADIESQYGAQLTALNGAGINVHDFVMEYYGSCYQNKQTQITNERTNQASAIGLKEDAIIKLEQATSAEVNTAMNTYSQQYTEDMAGMTGMHVPLNLSQCQNAQPSVQLGCLNDLRSNMESIMYGNTTTSQMNVQVPAQNPSNIVSFQCSGLNGCVTIFQNVSSNLKVEVAKVESFKKDYVQKANQSIKAYTEQMAQALGPTAQCLRDAANSINSSLSNLGVSSMIKLKDVPKEELTPNEDKDNMGGLYQTPKKVLNLIGSASTPVMPDFSSDDVSSNMQVFSDATEKQNEAQQKIADAQTEFNNKKAECGKENASKLQAAVDSFGSCISKSNFCEDNSDNVTNVLNYVSNLNLDIDVDSLGKLNCKKNSCKAQNARKVRAAENACQSKSPPPSPCPVPALDCDSDTDCSAQSRNVRKYADKVDKSDSDTISSGAATGSDDP